MKKQIIFSIIFMLMVTSVFATTVTRSMSSRVDSNQDITVTLSVAGATVGSELAIRDNMPFVVKEWTITGSEEEKQDTLSESETGKYSWVFTPTTATPKITYTMTTGSVNTYTFSGVYFDEAGMGNINDQSSSISTLIVREITCGDGYCEGSETYQTCSSDCQAPSQPQTQEPVTQTTANEEETNYDWVYLVAILIGLFAIFSFYGKTGKKTKKKK